MLINIEWVKRGGKGGLRGGEFSLLEIFKMLLSQSIALIFPLRLPLPQPTVPKTFYDTQRNKKERLEPLPLVTKKRGPKPSPLTDPLTVLCEPPAEAIEELFHPCERLGLL